MSWSAPFIAQLGSDQNALSLRLIICPETSPALQTPGPATEIVLTNYDETDSHNCIANVCRISGASVDPWTWRYTQGQIEIGFTAMRKVSGVEVVDQILRDILDAGVARGSAVELWAGFDTTDTADFERVFIGTLFDIQAERGRGARTAFRIIARDGVSFLTSVSNGVSTVGSLFTTTYTIQEVLTLAYTVGDTTLTMLDTTGFERETGGTGAVVVDGAGDPFILTYTGSTATTLTGCSVLGRFYTTAVNEAAATLYHAALLQGHPCDIFRRLLVSTGAGTNGSWDDYPQDWGLALPADYVAVSDIGNWKTATDSSEVWNLLIEEAVTNPLQWMEGIWGRAGMFAVHVQGDISIRAAQDITASPTEVTGITISDTTITAVEGWSAFDPSQPWENTIVEAWTGGDPRALTPQELFLQTGSVVYGFQSVIDGAAALSGASADAAFTRPSQETRAIDLSRCLWGPGYVAGNERTRMAPWYLDVREPITLLGRGLSWARFCPGDVINLTTALAFGYVESAGSGTYSAAKVMVTAGPDVDFLARTCRMKVVRLPDRVV